MSESRSPRQSSIASASSLGSLKLRKLRSAVLDAANPASAVRSLPAQTLHTLVIKDGIESFAEIWLLASVEQRRLILDFDCWKKDRFNENRLWSWLEMPDAGDVESGEGLQCLQKLLECIDLRFIGLLISKYVDSVTNDEPTENPPGPRYYTPDKGTTWINIETGDEHHDFLLGRFLALVFETDADLFYQLLSIPNVSTLSVLEEEAFLDRNKRLSGEGVPDFDTACEYCRPLNPKKLSRERTKTIEIDAIPSVPQLFEGYGKLDALETFLSTTGNRSENHTQITFLINCVLVRFASDYAEAEDLTLASEQTLGAINLAIEHLLADGFEMNQLAEQSSLSELFRTGLFLLFSLRDEVEDVVKQSSVSEEHKERLRALGKGFPADIAIEQDKDKGDISYPVAFNTLSQLDECRTHFRIKGDSVNRP